MLNDSVDVQAYFAKLGLMPDAANVYMVLHTHGSQSVLQLARNSKIERTRLYRLLDVLAEHNLIEAETLYKRKLYKAAPVSNLQILLSQREQELHDLEKDLAALQEQLKPAAERSPLTRVQFYQGKEGVKQMLWNQTKSHSENLTVLHENMQSLTNQAFFERWAGRCNSLGLQFRSLVGDHFLHAQRNWYADHTHEQLRFWQGRYIADSVFSITHSMAVYDDVVAYYNWKDGEVFGLEMYNAEIAAAQRQMFEMLWRQGRAIPGHGER